MNPLVAACLVMSVYISTVNSQALFYSSNNCRGPNYEAYFTTACQNLPSGYSGNTINSFHLRTSRCITFYDRENCLGHELANVQSPGCRKFQNLITTARSFRECSGRTHSVTVPGRK